VVDFLLRIDTKGHFQGLSIEAAKTEIYNIIDETFSHLGATRTKHTIFKSWLSKRGKSSARSVYPSSEELYEEARVHWHLPSDTQEWKIKPKSATSDPNNNDVRLIIGPESATRKTFYNALTDGLMSGERYSYKIFTSLALSPSFKPFNSSIYSFGIYFKK